MPPDEPFLSKSVGKPGVRLMELEMERGEALNIKLKLAPSLEALFKWAGRDKVSDRWYLDSGRPAHFYRLNGTMSPDGTDKAPALMAYFSSLGNVDNRFGQSLISGDRPNVALLRTRGAAEGIVLKFEGIYSEEALKDLGRALRDTVVGLYKQFIRKVRVRASLTIEEVY